MVYHVVSVSVSDIIILLQFIGPFPASYNLFINETNLDLRTITWIWSPVAPDCPAVYYNILASNCGSCPTTTNHTTVTCTDIPIYDSMCSFAVQTVVCGNITANPSKEILVILKDSIDHEQKFCTGAIISAILLGLFSLTMICVNSFVVILYFVRKKLMKVSSISESDERQYEDVSHQIPRFSSGSVTINTKKNVAYGQVV